MPFDGEPEGWTKCRLGEIAVLGGGTTPSKAEPLYWNNAVVPWATPSDITNLPVGVSRIGSTEMMVSERATQDCSLPLNPPGTVLMTSRATIGFVAINDVPMATNQGFITFRSNGRADPSFLSQWLTANRDLLVSASGGSTFKELGRSTAKLLPICLPLLDEQRRIAEVLQAIDEAVVCIASAQIASDALLARYRREVFTPLIPGDTDLAGCLGDICNLGRGFAFKSEDYTPEGILNFRVTNVGRSASDVGEKRFLPRSFLDQYPDYRLAGDEIVLVMVGATVGKLGKVPKQLCPALLNQNMWTLSPKRGISHALLWHLAHILIEQKIHSAQGGAYTFLTKGEFLNHRVGPIDLDALMPHIDAMSSIEVCCAEMAEAKAAFIETKRMVSNDLLSGRVRVPA